jgi:hypothetical protein
MTKRKATPRRQPEDFQGSRPGNDQVEVLSFKRAGGNLMEMSRVEHQESCIKFHTHEGLVSSHRCECAVKLILKDGREWEGVNG